MTEREKISIAFAEESAALDGAAKSGRFAPEVIADFRRRLADEFARNSGGLDAEGMTTPSAPRLTPVGDLPGVQAIQDAVDRMNQAIHDSRERFADSFAYGIESALRGDWQGVLRAVFGNVMNDALRSVGRSIFNAGGGGSGGFNFGNMFSSVGSWFSKLPGFSTGGSFKVGGSGGIDSKLVSMRLTPGEMVDIRRPGQDGGPSGSNVYQFSGNLMTPEFWRQIQGEVAAGEARAYGRAMNDAPKLTMSQTARQQRQAVGRQRRGS